MFLDPDWDWTQTRQSEWTI